MLGDIVLCLLALAFAGAHHGFILTYVPSCPLIPRSTMTAPRRLIHIIGLALTAWSLHLKPIHSSAIGEHVEKACKLVSGTFFARHSAVWRYQQGSEADYRLF